LAGGGLSLDGGGLGALFRLGMFPRFGLDKPVPRSAQNDAEDQSTAKTSHNVPFFDVADERSFLQRPAPPHSGGSTPPKKRCQKKRTRQRNNIKRWAEPFLWGETLPCVHLVKSVEWSNQMFAWLSVARRTLAAVI